MAKKAKTSFAVRVALASLIVFAIFSAVKPVFKVEELKEEKEALSQELADAQDQLIYFRRRLNEPITDDYIRRVAREKLNYRNPGDVLFYNDLAD